MTSPAITVIGAAHADYTIYIDGAVRIGRTNPASQTSIAGGVAANIARHMAHEQHVALQIDDKTGDKSGAVIGQRRSGMRVQFLGVTNLEQSDALQRHLASFGIKVRFITLVGPAPSYTAIMDDNGELVIGAACMDLYDAVAPDDILPFLPKTGCVVVDANFPKAVLGAMATTMPMAMTLLAAGTSVEKVKRLLPIIDRLDGLVLNRAEAAQLVPDSTTTEMAQRLATLMRPRAFALVSDGVDAAALAQNDLIVARIPEPLTDATSVKNVNGAGDAMAARLFSLYINGASRLRASHDLLDVMLQNALAAGAAFAAGEPNV